MKKIQDYLQIKAAAELLGVTASTLRNWERAGKLVSHRHPLNRYRLYKREDLEAFLQSIHVSKSQSPREA
ncbi:MAG TPA: helix-turn-helix domain-containing protein [Chlamydiales bacterium]|nr:helix-turn-helix domain-containing protein [Chlamydiales bacterium]